MDKFVIADVMTKPDGTETTVAEFSKVAYDGANIKVYINSKYQVVRRDFPSKLKGEPNLVWLSIKRRDKETIHDWRDMQEIKNELVGKECEGVELYPADSRMVDSANQYHLWCIDDKTFRFPFGFNERFIGGEDEASKVGAKQRPFRRDNL
ncbi:MAG: hypothetical protein WC208_10340 [Gallionella sp.]